MASWDHVDALKASRTLRWGQVSAEPYTVIFSRARWDITLPEGKKTVPTHTAGMKAAL